jgi:hypothetical protein
MYLIRINIDVPLSKVGLSLAVETIQQLWTVY